MSKVLFAPFSIAGGFIAGLVGRKVFEGLWSVIDKDDAPGPDQRGVRWGKLVLALVLEGAIFRAVRGVFDHGSREAFRRLTGSWPGDEPNEPKTAS